jgi:DNA invertase Pin-like site-specific DNA recombinase
MKKIPAFAYLRTSSATNAGPDTGSERRQLDAIQAYGAAAGYEIAGTFYDTAVSGADPVDSRPAFADMLAGCQNGGPKVILVENASRFARDLTVQLTGHAALAQHGITLIPVDAPDHFTAPGPTAEMVRQILGAVSQFEKAQLVAKLKHGRDKKRTETGRCEGRKPVPAEVVKEARRLARQNPVTHAKRSLREIAAELAALGHCGPSGKPYGAGSIARMLKAA